MHALSSMIEAPNMPYEYLILSFSLVSSPDSWRNHKWIYLNYFLALSMSSQWWSPTFLILEGSFNFLIPKHKLDLYIPDLIFLHLDNNAMKPVSILVKVIWSSSGINDQVNCSQESNNLFIYKPFTVCVIKEIQSFRSLLNFHCMIRYGIRL